MQKKNDAVGRGAATPSLRRALSHGGHQASWQPGGLVKSIAALEAEPTATSKRCGCALWGASQAYASPDRARLLARSRPGLPACPTSHFNVADEVVAQHDVDGLMSPATASFDRAAWAQHTCDQIAAIGPDGSLRGVSDTSRMVHSPSDGSGE